MTLDALKSALSDRYRIERELGAGGMATVYLADDIKHHRKVAIKVLRPELAAVIGAERFLAEIQTTANLQHPHILALIDSGVAGVDSQQSTVDRRPSTVDLLYYVMPYVEGESLRDRLVREKQLPITDAVRIATEVAGALDYAHRHNVIHRDIKPENILLHDGSALVADFGIALAASSGAGTRMTETGMSLGTPHYMSPEQAMGEREITARSDVYALGCVTYEMLVGEPPFSGPTAQAIIARVMTEEPRPLTIQRKTVPPHVEAAVFTALEKLPADRYASAAEFAAVLNGRTEGISSPTRTRTVRNPPFGSSRAAMLAAAALVVLAAAGGWLMRGVTTRPATTMPVEFSLRLGDGGRDRAFVDISPDGRWILQEVEDSLGVSRLARRDLGSTTITQIPGADDIEDPTISHDGKWIAFTRRGNMYKIPAEGGPATELSDSNSAGGSGWSIDDGFVVYTKSNDGLWRVPSSGGTPVRVTSLDTARREFNHWWPEVLPGGKAAIFTSYATPLDRARVEAVDLATGRRTTLAQGAVFGRYVTGGYLLYARGGAAFAVRFDPATLKVSGTATPVIEDLAWQPQDGLAGFAVSDNGTLVYLKGSEWKVDRRVIWSDRAGNEQAALPQAGSWAEPRLSPDGRWIALSQTEPKRDVWLFDRTRGVLSQLTHAQGAAFNAVWMPDSRSIIYTFEDPVYDLHRMAIDASAPDTAVVATPYDKRAHAISPDGQTLAYSEVVDRDRIMLLDLAGSTPRVFDDQPGPQRDASISPDGRWLAYDQSDQNGNTQVYVRALDGHAGRLLVSADGGNQPRWTKGGREIVYRQGSAMLAVPFDPATPKVGSPAALFQKPDAGQLDHRTAGYDVTPDGSRFLLVTPIARPEALPLHVIINWTSTLRRKVAQ